MRVIWICKIDLYQWEDISHSRNHSGKKTTTHSRLRLKLPRYFQWLTISHKSKANIKECKLKKEEKLCQSILESPWIKNSKRCSDKARLLTAIVKAFKARCTMSEESLWNWIKLSASSRKNQVSRQTLKMNMTTMMKRTHPKWAHMTKRHSQDGQHSCQTRRHNHSLWPLRLR